jgi:hypothetical protein
VTHLVTQPRKLTLAHPSFAHGRGVLVANAVVEQVLRVVPGSRCGVAELVTRTLVYPRDGASVLPVDDHLASELRAEPLAAPQTRRLAVTNLELKFASLKALVVRLVIEELANIVAVERLSGRLHDRS